MPTTAIPHLNFADGRARQALEFYQGVFDGDLLSHTYQDFGMPAGLPDSDRIVFGQISTADGVVLMGYDIPGSHPQRGRRRSLRILHLVARLRHRHRPVRGDLADQRPRAVTPHLTFRSPGVP